MAPLVFLTDVVASLGEVYRPRILRRIQIAHVDEKSVRRAGVGVAGMIRRGCRENAGERIHPRTRTKKAINRVFARVVGVRAADTKRREVRCRGAAKVAVVILIRAKSVFHPTLANLFEAVGVIRATAHAIKILGHNGVIRVREREKMDFAVTVVTRGRGDPKTNLVSAASGLDH